MKIAVETWTWPPDPLVAHVTEFSCKETRKMDRETSSRIPLKTNHSRCDTRCSHFLHLATLVGIYLSLQTAGIRSRGSHEASHDRDIVHLAAHVLVSGLLG